MDLFGPIIRKALLPLSAVLAPAALAQNSPNKALEHTLPFPNVVVGQSQEEMSESLALGLTLRRGIDLEHMLEQQRRLSAQIASLGAQQAGEVDAFVLVAALDSDPVFAREAREAGRVLSQRYSASGRTLVLAGPDGESDELAHGTVENLVQTLGAVARAMDTSEDVLVLYTTSHGMQAGLVHHYGDSSYGVLSPALLKRTLEELGLTRRIVIISACQSGVFVPALASRDTAVLTAAAAQRNSFGCQPDNDWTFFGDALINRALRKPQSLSDAAREAAVEIAGWEAAQGLLASLPQSAFGAGVSGWLPALEARMPQVASAPVGRPSVAE
ncbi:C13 family peptidase [Qipengyuania sp. S6317L1]|uniref:C13 family peptidase n=1 Tax=Qipengyuania sp. S6317L1 TaxID=2926410 RepID=UPI001FF6DDF8|nr:C13 family peptidase [Qipengyuania sp. S6317L1]